MIKSATMCDDYPFWTKIMSDENHSDVSDANWKLIIHALGVRLKKNKKKAKKPSSNTKLLVSTSVARTTFFLYTNELFSILHKSSLMEETYVKTNSKTHYITQKMCWKLDMIYAFSQSIRFSFSFSMFEILKWQLKAEYQVKHPFFFTKMLIFF